MIDNYLCESCSKVGVCRINDILSKFDTDAKKQLGVDITMDECQNFDDATKDAVCD